MSLSGLIAAANAVIPPANATDLRKKLRRVAPLRAPLYAFALFNIGKCISDLPPMDSLHVLATASVGCVYGHDD